MTRQPPFIIVGGGLAGSVAALLLAERRPEIDLLVIEAAETFGGNHTWSFFDTDMPAEAAGIIKALCPVRWSRHRLRFPNYERDLPVPYNAVSGKSLDRLVRSRLRPSSCRLGTAVRQLAPDGVVLDSGERVAARGVVDARGPDEAMPGLDLGWQKFVGIEFAATADDPDCALLMDATVPQCDGYRFAYVLPLSSDRVLVEDTYYSEDNSFDCAVVAERVRKLAETRGLSGTELRQEHGVLPIVISGDPDVFWPANDPVARLGLRGGFFHPTTGYSFSCALRMALGLARRETMKGDEVAAWSRGQFTKHWRGSRYFRLLNRMMFRAAAPDQRHRIFDHFYRMPPPTIGRFYAGDLHVIDKVRLLSGRPPVPVGAALSALIGPRRIP